MIHSIQIFYRKRNKQTFEAYSLWFLNFYLSLLNLEANILAEQIENIIFRFDQSYISNNNLSVHGNLSTLQSSIDIMLSFISEQCVTWVSLIINIVHIEAGLLMASTPADKRPWNYRLEGVTNTLFNWDGGYRSAWKESKVTTVFSTLWATLKRLCFFPPKQQCTMNID